MRLGDCLQFTKSEVVDCRPGQRSAGRVVIAVGLVCSEMCPRSMLGAGSPADDTEDARLKKTKGAFKKMEMQESACPMKSGDMDLKHSFCPFLSRDSCRKQSKTKQPIKSESLFMALL